MTRSSTTLSALMLVLVATGCTRPGERILERRPPLRYLQCDTIGPRPAPVTQVIGPNGGTIVLGGNSVTVPREAVREDRTFTFALAGRDSVGVHLTMEPREPRVRYSMVLSIDATRCPNSRLDERRWEVFRNHGQRLRTDRNNKHYSTFLDSASVFMIAN